MNGSGDLTADRRFEMARQFAARNDLDAAVDLMQQAVELVPNWPPGWFQLGQLQARAGQRADAAIAFRQCLELDPEDTLGASLELSLMEGGKLDTMPPDGRLPDAYVRALFDDYAPRFDTALVERLRYRAPALVRQAVDRVRPGPAGNVLDLGCGTGLSGLAFRDSADRLTGVDLSPRMAAEAARKDIYAELAVAEIGVFLRDCAAVFDTVLAVDVLIYLGALDGVFAQVRRVLRPGGVFAFTVQAGESGDFTLGQDHRYSYGEAYLHEAAAGWRVALLEPCILREDAGHDVAGFVCVLC